MMNRWTFPIVPDLFGAHASPAQYKRNHVYLEDGVILTRCGLSGAPCQLTPRSGCALKENVIVGAGTRIGRDNAVCTVLSNSVVGRGCTIG